MTDELVQTLIQIRTSGVDVVDVVRPYEEVTGRLPVEHLRPGWIAFWSGFSPASTGFYAKCRRMVDVLGSLILIIISAPVTLLAALCIRLESGGSVLYRQERVGQNDRVFTLWKLRTMRADAESGTGAVWAKIGDPRVTRVGRLLRNLRIDEFPQLWNVLRGEMTLIGPRPERPEFVEMLEAKLPHYALRHMVKPGVTGWAQVSAPYASSIDDTLVKLEYDLYYIRHRGPLLDARILLKTVGVLLFAQGSR